MQLYPEYDFEQIDLTPTKLSLMVLFQKIWEEENMEPQVSIPGGLQAWHVIVRLLAQLPKEHFKNWNEIKVISKQNHQSK